MSTPSIYVIALRFIPPAITSLLVWTTFAAALGIIFLPPESVLRDNVAAVLILSTLSTCAIFLCRAKKKSTCTPNTVRHSRTLQHGVCLEGSAMPNPNQLQHWSRTQTISGEEQISAILRADFAAQQLATTLHLPFCPPFSAPPQVSILSLDNKENASEKLTCHTTRILPAGARIDLKRTQKDSAQHWIAVEIKGR